MPEEQNDDISEDCENCEIRGICVPEVHGWTEMRYAHLAACEGK